jgi:SAM-dependent methyltransferase
MTSPVDRFSNRVANYAKYRADYPREIVGYLKRQSALTNESIVADIGCGTGLSTMMFLENGNRVFGVEPNAPMRAAAVDYLREFPDFKPIDGTSENTNLNDASVDLIVAAQAFHWFEPEKTRTEFKRILKPSGHVALMWNERQLDTTPFLVEYEAFLLKYATDYEKVRHENVDKLRLREFFQGPYMSATFNNIQVFDFDGLKGRMFSSSYMPNEDDPIAQQMVDALQALFAKHEQDGRINILYDTNVYLSRL